MRARRAAVAAIVITTLSAGLLATTAGATPHAADPETAPLPVQVVAGYTHTCALLDDGTVKCWGANHRGQLGYGDTNDRGDANGEMGDDLPTVSLGAGRTAVGLTTGRDHTCAILDDGHVKCWGRNDLGQLGLGDTNDRGDANGEMGDSLPAVNLGTGRTAIGLVAGDYHTCVLLDNETVKCWGDGFSAQLGQGNLTMRGDAAGEMGDNLPPISLGTGRTAIALAAGEHHTCALLDDGRIKCWGENFRGQLGYEDLDMRSDFAGEMGDNLPFVDLGTGRTAVTVTAGLSHTCAVLDDGTLKCWGFNNFGQLGLGDTDNRGDALDEMGDQLPTVNLGAGRTADFVVTGDQHTCVRLDDDSVKCFGYNGFGQLGLGDTAARGDGANETGAALAVTALGTGRHAVQLTAGAAHTCARLDNDSVKCWGDSSRGQLGYGSFANRGDAAGEMGDALPAVDLGGGTPPVTRQVDAEIRKSTQTTYTGNDVRNTNAAGQTINHSVRRGTSASYVVRLRNEGSATDDLRVSGPASSGAFTIRYFNGATNVTTQVVAGTFTFAGVPANATRKLSVRVTVAANATVNSTKTVKVRATSVGDTTKKDAVAVVVKSVR
ncbi:MAG: hypothetical protein JNK12_04965 [Acidimicrobiales bacterium]|nr:hypothetical protein [Acidimicrobiales bacterium]